MNLFRTYSQKNLLKHLFIGVIILTLNTVSALGFQIDESSSRPIYKVGTSIYTDLDVKNQIVYVLVDKELWRYDLNTMEWIYLSKIKPPNILSELEFGYNNDQDMLLFWDRGIGKVYEIDLSNYNVTRLDLSFSHKNQYGHFPFFRNQELYAFGGYGFWEWNNLITFYNSELKEWNLVEVENSSTKPQKREAVFGAYNNKIDGLYIFGGKSSQSELQDGKNVKKINLYGIWKFSFMTHSWNKLSNLNLPDTYKVGRNDIGYFGHTNTISSSLFSDKSNLWYIPVHSKENSKLSLYFKTINVIKNEEYPIFEMPNFVDKEIAVSNFLYNSFNNSVILIQVDYLTNRQDIPIDIFVVSEDSLSALAKEKSMPPVLSKLIVIPFIVIALLFLLFRKGWVKNQFKNLTKKEISDFDWLNQNEKDFILTIWNSKSKLDSLELEELVWSEIENYDYRRKVRNETINSINDKFSSNLNSKKSLITRIKDPNDKRRSLYAINSEIENS